MFTERTLRSVVADLNRYSHKSITVTDPALTDIRISGAVKVEQIEDWLNALSSVLDVELSNSVSGILLRPRTKTVARS